MNEKKTRYAVHMPGFEPDYFDSLQEAKDWLVNCDFKICPEDRVPIYKVTLACIAQQPPMEFIKQ